MSEIELKDKFWIINLSNEVNCSGIYNKINALRFLGVGGREESNRESRIYLGHVNFEIGISYNGEGARRQLDIQF